MIISDEFEKCFDIPVTDDIIYSFQEKYIALKKRKVDAVKIITDKIHYVYRRTLSETHRWKFEDNDISAKINKILGHIINLVKSELDGTSYRAISETQHKTVEIFKSILGIEGELEQEVEQRLMELVTKYNTFDVINESIQIAKNFKPQMDFLNKVDNLLSIANNK